MIYIVILCSVVILYSIIVSILNLKNIKKPLVTRNLSQSPFISVLIPARNEAKNIEHCIRSLFSQSYQNKEILVLDDLSDDNTLKILKKLQFEYPSLKIIKGKKRPSGWIGKSWACHCLSLEANGCYIIFLDADTVLKPTCLTTIVSTAIYHKVDAISIMPMLQTYTFGEKMIVPLLLCYTILSYFPLFAYFVNKNPKMLIGWGFMMLFSRQKYLEVNGHASIKEHIMDDVALLRKISQNKGKIFLVNGSKEIYCRMYTCFEDVFSGLLRGSVPYVNKSPIGYIGLSFCGFFIYTLIPIWLAYSIATGLNLAQTEILLSGFISISPIIMRLIFSIKFKVDLITVPLIFLGGIIIPYLIAYSSYIILTRGTVSWKGRIYSTKKINA